ncbi:MAG TPA: hypothetical protein P5560_08930 [Thermotogota bacterium]|nr:hypothetical protein [Thermotogota bacterium]HRW93054.1 hypothetical protein [Thermotogota bacterium]
MATVHGHILWIVVAGSHRNVGKSTVGEFLRKNLTGAFFVKVGGGVENPGKAALLLPLDVSLQDVQARIPPGTRVVILESGRLASQVAPKVLLFCSDPEGEDKPEASPLREEADLVAYGSVSCPQALQLAQRMGLPPRKMGSLLNLLQVKVKGCQLGLFP